MKFPDIFVNPELAVNVPLLSVTSVLVTAPVDPVKVPPDIVKPPLNVCVAVDAK